MESAVHFSLLKLYGVLTSKDDYVRRQNRGTALHEDQHAANFIDSFSKVKYTPQGEEISARLRTLRDENRQEFMDFTKQLGRRYREAQGQINDTRNRLQEDGTYLEDDILGQVHDHDRIPPGGGSMEEIAKKSLDVQIADLNAAMVALEASTNGRCRPFPLSELKTL